MRLQGRREPTGSVTIRVVSAEDSYPIREGLPLLFAAQDHLELGDSVTNLPALGGVLAQYVEPEFALRVFASGSRTGAYLQKERLGDLGELRHANEAVPAGGSVLDPGVIDALLQARARQRDAAPSRLSPRELEALEIVAEGLCSAGIADRLNLAPAAVHKHIPAIRASQSPSPGA